MIAHSRKFERLASAPVKTTDVQVARQVIDTFDYYDDSLVWTSSDILISTTIDCVGVFLGAAMKKAVVKLMGIVDTASAGETFQIRLGLYDTDTLSFNYISQGFYLVEDVAYDYDAGSTTITMYDYMWKANESSYTNFATESGFIFPATVEQFAEQMAAGMGVQLMEGFSSLPNSGYSILSDPFANDSSATLRSAVQEIASATGTTAKISDTTLVFHKYELNQALL